MKQLDLFNTSKSQKTDQKHTWLLFVDGASRNNPGPSGAGIYVLKDNVPVYKDGFYLGIKTNNQAEYLALLLGLFVLEQRIHPGDSIRIVSDSELLVKQLKGEYKVRRPHLKPLHALAQTILHTLKAEIMHILRDGNVQADKMANRGIDDKKLVPEEFVAMLECHEIAL